jgi:hypothetical protein
MVLRNAEPERLPASRPRQAIFSGRNLFVLLLALACFAFAVWQSRSEQRAVDKLPADARAALYARTIETLEKVCGPSRVQQLDAFCRDQAELAVSFHECDARCHALANPLAFPMPTR